MTKVISFEEACAHRNAHFALMPFGVIDKNGDLNNELINKMPAEQKELLAFCIQHWDETMPGEPPPGGFIVATLNQLSIPPGRISKGGPASERLFRKDRIEKPLYIDAKIELAHFMKVNFHYKTGGRYYVFNEAKTKTYLEELKENITERREAAEQEKIVGDAFKGGIAAIATGKPTKAPVTKEAKPKKIWLVDIDMKVIEAPEGYNPDDYLTEGTKAHCEKYVIDEENKTKK